MSEVSLYRRHRPRTFEDVVGQDHVVRTLRNAIEQDKVHHAYLFVGSRGTGKTSMAKILASCLDCERGGPTVHPCGECDSCLAIQRATSLDVVEMDAASNNSVDDVRELRERVQTAPSGGKWRVYILDEAHMLTTQAWNALLKTLEEPPPQTVFVLATTEAHKVPATVVDRCHRFDFTRPTGEQIGRVLGRVAESEHITMNTGALALVARHANGSFRDALGTLEQLVTYSGNEVTEQDAVTVLGIGDDAQIFAGVEAVIDRDAGAALRVVQDVASHGRDLGSYARELERHARDLLVCCILGGVPPEVRLTPDRDQRLDDQARRIGRDQATHLLELLAAALTAARDGADQRAMLELALVKAADPSVDPGMRAMQSRMARLEERFEQAAPPARPAAPAAAAPAATAGTAAPATTAAPTSAPAAEAAPTPQAAAPPPPPAPQAPAPQAPAPQVAAPAPPAPAPSSYDAYEPAPFESEYDSAPQEWQEQPPAPRAAPQAPPEPRVAPPAPLAAVADLEPTGLRAVPPPAPAPGAAPGLEEPPPALAAVPAPRAGGPSLDELVAVWDAVLDNLRTRDQLCAVALERARPVGIDGTELTIAFPTDAAFYRGTADREERRLALREALKEVTGAALSARFELRDLTQPDVPLGEAGGPPVAPAPLAAKRVPTTLDENAVVAHLVTEFDAEELADPDQEPA